MIYFLLFCVVTPEDIPVTTVDLVEVNHYQITENHTKVQLIFYDWSPSRKRYEIVDYIYLDRQGVIPVNMGRYYECLAIYRRRHLVKVRALTKCETWSNFDPERKDKDERPLEFRRMLNK